MGRVYLLIIIVGVLIGAMLPSGPPAKAPVRDSSGPATTHLVDPGRGAGGTEASVPIASVVAGQGTTLTRSPDGHFYADAQVNGVTIHFLVDTGATGVALSAADARRVGLLFFPTEFAAVGRGASGEVRGKLVTLDRVSLGGKSVHDVGGAILEGSDMSLLGQSFLSRMGTIEITPDRMVIR